MEERCQQEAYKIKRQKRKLTRQRSEFVENDINTSRITIMEADLARIRDMKDDYQDAVEEFLDTFSTTIGVGSIIETWTQEISAVSEDVKRHADRIRTRAAKVSAATGSTIIGQKTLEIQEASLKLHELSFSNSRQTSE